jgi:hypothetical protein
MDGVKSPMGGLLRLRMDLDGSGRLRSSAVWGGGCRIRIAKSCSTVVKNTDQPVLIAMEWMSDNIYCVSFWAEGARAGNPQAFIRRDSMPATSGLAVSSANMAVPIRTSVAPSSMAIG